MKPTATQEMKARMTEQAHEIIVANPGASGNELDRLLFAAMSDDHKELAARNVAGRTMWEARQALKGAGS